LADSAHAKRPLKGLQPTRTGVPVFTIGRRSPRRNGAAQRNKSSDAIPATMDGDHVGVLGGVDDSKTAERFRELVDANVVGVGYGRADRIYDSNAALMSTIGAQPTDLRVGIPLSRLFGRNADNVEAFLSGPTHECDITRVDGKPAHLLTACIRLPQEPGWLVITVDLTERKAAERAIEYLALHDPTTGVPNRRLLIDRLGQALVRAARQQSVTGVLFCDIDRFKHINDTYGHRTGDAVLQTTALRLESVLRKGDTVARVGGDEFVILLENLPDPTDASRLAERARVVINQPIDIDQYQLRVTTSVGIALACGPDEDADSVLRRADNAMYVAKDRGRNQVALDTATFSLPPWEQ
jgi:diguanylate cyclase (GGDEF)-like protein